jgi:hypothetical protein
MLTRSVLILLARNDAPCASSGVFGKTIRRLGLVPVITGERTQKKRMAFFVLVVVDTLRAVRHLLGLPDERDLLTIGSFYMAKKESHNSASEFMVRYITYGSFLAKGP